MFRSILPTILTHGRRDVSKQLTVTAALSSFVSHRLVTLHIPVIPQRLQQRPGLHTRSHHLVDEEKNDPGLSDSSGVREEIEAQLAQISLKLEETQALLEKLELLAAQNLAQLQPVGHVPSPTSSTSSTSTPSSSSSSSSNFVTKQPQEGLSFFQPKPANGYVTVNASHWYTPNLPFSQGKQVLPPLCSVREHTHTHQYEVITCLSGQGEAHINGTHYPMTPGTTITLAPGSIHSFHNLSSTDELHFLWTISRNQDGTNLEDFFKSVGRIRQLNDPTPSPFDRPADPSIDSKGGVKA